MQTAMILKSGNRTFIDRAMSPAEGSSLWESFPCLASLTDPSVAFGLEDHFVGLDAAWTVTQFTSGTVAAGTTTVGGTALFSAGASTAGQGVELQRAGSAFGYSASGILWSEARLSVSSLAGRFVWGLAPVGTLVSGTTLAAADFVGFSSLTGDGVVLFGSAKSVGSTQSSGPVKTLVVGTFVKLGFVWDMATPAITAYVDGVAVGTVLATSGAIPTNLLTPSFCCRAAGTGTPTLSLDWVKVKQLQV